MEGEFRNHPNPRVGDIQLRKTFPGRGKCWFHRVFHKPLPAACFLGLSLSLLPGSGGLNQPESTRVCCSLFRKKKKRRGGGRESPTSWKHRAKYCFQEHRCKRRRAWLCQGRSCSSSPRAEASLMGRVAFLL